MKIKQSLRIIAILALCATALAWQNQDGLAEGDGPSLRPVTVIAVRHAEKGADDPRDPGLTEEGARRAAALAKLLSHAGVTHIYSTGYRRTQATVEPLATRLELDVEEYSPRDLNGFSEGLKGLPLLCRHRLERPLPLLGRELGDLVHPAPCLRRQR